MHRLLVGALIFLLSAPVGLAATPIPLGVAATADPAQPTTLESLPLSHAVSVSILSSANAGKYDGYSIEEGLQFTATQASAPDSDLEVDLGNHYANLVGTIYGDTASACSGNTTIQDVSNPATGIKKLYQGTVYPGQQESFSLDMQGVAAINVDEHRGNGCYGSTTAETVDVVTSLTEAAPTAVTILTPTANTVVPRDAAVDISWQKFSGASAYELDVSMLKQSTDQPITATSELSFTRLVLPGTSYTWQSAGFLPGLYGVDIVPVDKYGSALVARSAGIHFIISS